MIVAIVNYRGGNVCSVQNAIRRLGCEPLVTNSPEELLSADRVIFPGVGEASSAMLDLQKSGLVHILPTLKQPFLGICLGFQLMGQFSEEGKTAGLGIFPVHIKRFVGNEPIPHMGWNNVKQHHNHLLWAQINDNSDFYFVHSYYAPINEWTIGTAEYIHPFAAAMAHQNFMGVQFHPEKSGEAGSRLLQNFLSNR